MAQSHSCVVGRSSTPRYSQARIPLGINVLGGEKRRENREGVEKPTCSPGRYMVKYPCGLCIPATPEICKGAAGSLSSSCSPTPSQRHQVEGGQLRPQASSKVSLPSWTPLYYGITTSNIDGIQWRTRVFPRILVLDFYNDIKVIIQNSHGCYGIVELCYGMITPLEGIRGEVAAGWLLVPLVPRQ